MAERNLDAFCATLREYLAEKTIRKMPLAYDPEGRGVCSGNPRLPRNTPITTNGRIGPGASGFVYVAGPNGDEFKIGMSSNPEKRCKALKLPLIFALEVPAAIVRSVETEALRRCGNCVGDGEWVRRDLIDVIQAVQCAALAVRCDKYAKNT